MKVEVVLPAAGSGIRLGHQTPKALVSLGNISLIIRCLHVIEQCILVTHAIVVTQPELKIEFESVIQQAGLTKVKAIVEGGETRCASVKRGVEALDEDTNIVVVHDAARPLVTQQLLENIIKTCEHNEAVIAAVPVKSTLKRVNANQEVVETIDRSSIYEVQTPQAFHKEILVRAHEQKTNDNATDDASLVEALGIKVKVVEGDYNNIKITTKEDLIIAEAIVEVE